jgi:Amt family ammonium transporter
VNGAFGILATGIFANGVYGQGLNGVAYGVTGLLYGDSGQFVASLIGIAANVVWVVPVAALSFWLIGKLVGNRVSAEDEVAGLDIPEMGVHGYSADPGPGMGVTPHAYGATASAAATVATVAGR